MAKKRVNLLSARIFLGDRPWFESYCSLNLYFLLKLFLLLLSFEVFHFFSRFI
jgi:hypothetical protein